MRPPETDGDLNYAKNYRDGGDHGRDRGSRPGSSNPRDRSGIGGKRVGAVGRRGSGHPGPVSQKLNLLSAAMTARTISALYYQAYWNGTSPSELIFSINPLEILALAVYS